MDNGTSFRRTYRRYVFFRVMNVDMNNGEHNELRDDMSSINDKEFVSKIIGGLDFMP